MTGCRGGRREVTPRDGRQCCEVPEGGEGGTVHGIHRSRRRRFERKAACRADPGGRSRQGPYAVGALASLAERSDLDVTTVIGASSGALNGAVYAAGLRAGCAGEAARLLNRLPGARSADPLDPRAEAASASSQEALGEIARTARKSARSPCAWSWRSLPDIAMRSVPAVETVFDFGSESFAIPSGSTSWPRSVWLREPSRASSRRT